VGISDPIPVPSTWNKNNVKHRLYLTDKSRSEIVVEVWNKTEDSCKFDGLPAIIVKACIVKEFGGSKFLSATPSTTIWVRSVAWLG
jgi:hypothetical protein